MAEPMLGWLGVTLESLSNRGIVPLLGDTLVSSLPASLSTQPNAISGMSTFSGARLLIEIVGNNAVGTITVTGKDFTQAQNALAETTNSIPVAGTGSNPTGTYYYLTTGVYSTVNASGVTVSGLTGGKVRIFGIPAASKLVPCMADIEMKYPLFSPDEHRGLTSRDTNMTQLVKQVTIGKIEQPFYPDTGLWVPFVGIGAAPAVATMPASPTALKSTTAVASFPITTWTAQPNTIGPDSLIQLVVTGSSAVGQVTVRGTTRWGQTISEVVQCGVPGAANGNGTWYTNQAFASLDTSTGATVTGLTGGSVAFNGLIGVQRTWLGADSGTGASSKLYTTTLEWFTGTDALIHPFSHFTEISLEGSTEKEMKWSAKGGAQDQLIIGDKTVTPMQALTAAVALSTNIGAFSQLWQPFDVNSPGWRTSVFIDSLSGTAGTTGYNSVLDWKITWKVPQKPSYTATNTQRMSKLYRQKRETEIELTVIFDDVIQYTKFEQNFVKQLVNIQFFGPYLGTYNSQPTFANWSFIYACKTIEFKRDPAKEAVQAKLKLKTEYTPTLGYEFKLITQNQQNPNYEL